MLIINRLDGVVFDSYKTSYVIGIVLRNMLSAKKLSITIVSVLYVCPDVFLKYANICLGMISLEWR